MLLCIDDLRAARARGDGVPAGRVHDGADDAGRLAQALQGADRPAAQRPPGPFERRSLPVLYKLQGFYRVLLWNLVGTGSYTTLRYLLTVPSDRYICTVQCT